MNHTSRMAKAQLAAHLGQPHGGSRHVEPLADRLRWSKDELENAHRNLLAAGPCPPVAELRVIS